jgi:hypothetical protein
MLVMNGDFPIPSCFLAKPHPKSVNLGQVVQHDYELPLAVDLFFALQAESFDPDGVTDVTEDGFDNANIAVGNSRQGDRVPFSVDCIKTHL